MDKVGSSLDGLNQRIAALEDAAALKEKVGGGEIPIPSMEEKTFTFEGIPNLEQFCLEMEGFSLTIPELPTFTFPEMEITWPEIQKLCGME